MAPVKDNSTEGYTWLGRTHFSRSICYGLNSCAISGMSGSLLENSNFKGFHKLIGTDLDTSSELIANGVLRSPNIIRANNEVLLPSASAVILQPLMYESSSVDTSPEKISSNYRYQRSLSLPSKCSSAHLDEEEKPSYLSGEYSFEETQLDDGSELNATRTTSWSDYFVKPGNEVAVEQAENWMVDLSDLFLGHKFAAGAYSRVYLGNYKDSAVAVKMLRKPDNDEGISVRLDREFNAEVNVLSRVHHRNVVKFIGACKKPPVCCIITEYLALGSVKSYLHYQPFPLALKLAVDMALDIARGMEYLHSQGVIHRDLKSENLVIAEDMCVKITDFGVACFEWETSPMTDDVGTYRWMAPEMISKKHFSKKADIYSFGIVLWELLTGHVPFEDYTPVQAAFAVVHKHARPPLPLSCPSTLGFLLQQCWHADPDKRPGFTKVIGVLEEMRESILLNRSISLFHRHHKHAHGLLHCFGRCASHHVL